MSAGTPTVFQYRGREGMHTGVCISAGTPEVSCLAGWKGCIREYASRRARRQFPGWRDGRDAYGSMHLGGHASGFHFRGIEGMHAGGCISAGTPAVPVYREGRDACAGMHSLVKAAKAYAYREGRDAYGSMHLGRHAGGFQYRGSEGMHAGGCISGDPPAPRLMRRGCILALPLTSGYGCILPIRRAV
jgi:hypothetical protein